MIPTLKLTEMESRIVKEAIRPLSLEASTLESSPTPLAYLRKDTMVNLPSSSRLESCSFGFDLREMKTMDMTCKIFDVVQLSLQCSRSGSSSRAVGALGNEGGGYGHKCLAVIPPVPSSK